MQWGLQLLLLSPGFQWQHVGDTVTPSFFSLPPISSAVCSLSICPASWAAQTPVLLRAARSRPPAAGNVVS